jgi:hypothetical protein
MERLRPLAASYRPRSLRPLRCAVAALAGALLLFPATAAGATTSPSTPAAATVEGAVATIQSQLTVLGGQIQVAAARERRLEGVVSAWSDRYTTAQERVARLSMRAEYLRDSLAEGRTVRTSVPAIVAEDALLRSHLQQAKVQMDALSQSMPPVADMFRAQRVMRHLQSIRQQALSLIAALQSSEQSSALLSLAAAVQGSQSVTYGEWATLLLQQLGAPTCQNNLTALVSWQAAEFTQAGWNPLATTYDMPNATSFNSVGVRNYASLADGLTATVATLRGGAVSYGYDWIIYRLTQCSAPSVTAGAINASMWCHGCAGGTYVTGLVPRVEADYQLYARL